MSRISVLLQLPMAEHATSFYRAVMPFSYLRKSMNLDFVSERELGWAAMAKHDIIFIQRPMWPNQLKVAELAKQMGKPVWLDYDDDLFIVPTDNPNYQVFETPGAKETILSFLKLADVVTVSTIAIKEGFEARLGLGPNPKIRVVPNALADHFVKSKRPATWSNKICTWRGSHTHQKDLMSVAVEMVKANRELPQWGFEFLGYNPFFITELMRRGSWRAVPEQGIYDYLEYMKALAPGVHVVPLFENEFNRGKSNIAWIEATWAGAAVIAPPMREWGRRGITTYDEDATISANLKLFDENPEMIEKANKDSWECIQDEYLLSEVNNARQFIIEELL